MDRAGKKKKILLVEDDAGLANVYQARLEAEGFDVYHCDNGESALSDAMKYRPDLILLDVMMPKISGFDVLDILHNTPETQGIKIVMLTALSQDADKQRAEELGADDYLVKSQVVIADVIERIKYHLNIGEGNTPEAIGDESEQNEQGQEKETKDNGENPEEESE